MNPRATVGPFVAMPQVLPLKPIHVKDSDKSATASAAAAAAPAAASGSGQFPPPTPLQTPPYSALRTPRTPALLDAFGKGDSLVTHFAPPETKGIAEHTLKTLVLAFKMFETYLGCKFPYKALQTASRTPVLPLPALPLPHVFTMPQLAGMQLLIPDPLCPVLSYRPVLCQNCQAIPACNSLLIATTNLVIRAYAFTSHTEYVCAAYC